MYNTVSQIGMINVSHSVIANHDHSHRGGRDNFNTNQMITIHAGSILIIAPSAARPSSVVYNDTLTCEDPQVANITEEEVLR